MQAEGGARCTFPTLSAAIEYDLSLAASEQIGLPVVWVVAQDFPTPQDGIGPIHKIIGHGWH
jgi:hypothetical protein